MTSELNFLGAPFAHIVLYEDRIREQLIERRVTAVRLGQATLPVIDRRIRR